MSRIGDSSQNELISQLRGFLRDNLARRPGVGTITRVGIQAVNIKLTETGTLLRAIDVIGGVGGLAEGDTLYLLYFADNRVVGLRPGDLGMSELRALVAGKADTAHDHPGAFGLHVVLEVKPGATIPYAPDGAGLALALAAAGPGEVIYLPPLTISGDFTVPAGVNLFGLDQHAAAIAGQVTGTDGASLQNLTVSQVGASSTALVGVSGPVGGATFRLKDVTVIVLQAGSGPAYGIELAGGGDVIFTDCEVHALSVDGAGYGLRVFNGDAYGIGGRLSGSTDRILLG